MIVVVGSCVFDMVFHTPHLPVLGESVFATHLSTHSGGKGLNQAVAAARASTESVTMIGKVGNDAHGQALIDSLAEAGVDAHIGGSDVPTGIGVPMINPDGDNGIVAFLGANEQMGADDVRAASEHLAKADLLLLQLELPIEASIEAARIASASGTTVMLSAAPAKPIDAELEALLDVVVANDFEAQRLGGVADGREIGAGDLRAMLGVDVAIVTRGADGVDFAGPDGEGHLGAFPVDVVDSVGAGDTFSGAFAAEYLPAGSLVDAVRFGTAAAALSVTRAGAGTSAPHRHEVLELLDAAGSAG